MYYEVDKVFNRIIDREMEILIKEKEKKCQEGKILDEARDKIIEAYFLKKEYEKMKKLSEYKNERMNYYKEESERYEFLLKEEKQKNKKGGI